MQAGEALSTSKTCKPLSENYSCTGEYLPPVIFKTRSGYTGFIKRKSEIIYKIKDYIQKPESRHYLPGIPVFLS